MTFSFTNAITSELSKSPIEALINNLMSGYEQGTNLRYLKPTREEELKKARLYNQYYGPNIESEMGLRGAHAGLLGEQTRAAHLQNEALPEQLKAQMESYRLKQVQDKMFNDMLRQRLSGTNSQGGMGQSLPGNYQPGMGQAPFMQQNSALTSPMQQPSFDQGQPFSQPMPQQTPFDFNQAPQLTNDDIVNKKYFNLDTFTPKYKAYVDSIAKNMNTKNAEQFKLDAKEALLDWKESSKAQNDVPVLENALKTAYRMREIIRARPALFGHWLAPNLLPKRTDDPLLGEFQAELVPLIADTEKQLSEKGNQLALKTSANKVPLASDRAPVAEGKMNALIDSLLKRLEVSRNLGGGNIVRRGTKRFINKDGHWYEVKRGEF